MEFYRASSLGRRLNGRTISIGRGCPGRVTENGPVLWGYGKTDDEALDDFLAIARSRPRKPEAMVVELIFRGHLDPALPPGGLTADGAAAPATVRALGGLTMMESKVMSSKHATPEINEIARESHWSDERVLDEAHRFLRGREPSAGPETVDQALILIADRKLTAEFEEHLRFEAQGEFAGDFEDYGGSSSF